MEQLEAQKTDLNRASLTGSRPALLTRSGRLKSCSQYPQLGHESDGPEAAQELSFKFPTGLADLQRDETGRNGPEQAQYASLTKVTSTRDELQCPWPSWPLAVRIDRLVA